jgi:hypothetical protein
VAKLKKSDLEYVPLRDNSERANISVSKTSPVETIKVVDTEIVLPLKDLNNAMPVAVDGKINIRVNSILNTPPPYKQPWLDANRLEVIYMKGRAVLRFKK